MSDLDIKTEVAALERMTVRELHGRYAEVFGEQPRSRHRRYLARRIAWRLQANAEGGLTARALRLAEGLADEAEVRVTAPRRGAATNIANIVNFASSGNVAVPAALARLSTAPDRDRRVPIAGTAIVRDYKGRRLAVNVLPDGFEHAGVRHRSLSAVAKAITGTHVNGFRFFGLETKR